MSLQFSDKVLIYSNTAQNVISIVCNNS